MKLTSMQVKETLSQFPCEVIPDNHPVVPELNSLFGEHTFFLDDHGLNILEPTEARGTAVQSAKVVNVAIGAPPIRNSWSFTSRKRPTSSSHLDPNTDPEVGRSAASAAATSASRFTAGACGFLNLSQSGDRLVPATLLWLAHP